MQINKGFLIASLAIAAGVAWGVWWELGSQRADSAALVLMDMPLQNSEGQSTFLAQWRGQFLLLNFWATWCQPCREEMPLLDEIAHEQAGLSRTNRLQILGIALDSAANVREYSKSHPLSYPLLLAPTGMQEHFPALSNPSRSIPFSVLLSPQGKVLQTKNGAFKGSELREWLNNHSSPNGLKMK